jgi:hypothetical protein
VQGELEATRVWEWLVANLPLDEKDEWVEFIHAAWPIWRVRPLYEAVAIEFEERNRQKLLERQKEERRGDD